MTTTLRALATTAIAAAAVALPATAPAPLTGPVTAHAATTATIDTFAGRWIGHTRGLLVTRTGRVYEHIGDGCCDPLIDMKMRVIAVSGTTDRPRAKVRVTSVDLHNPSFSDGARVRVGQTGWLTIRAGVLTEGFTNATFCNRAAGRTGICGA